MTSLCVPGLLLNGDWLPPIRIYGGSRLTLTDILLSESGSIFPGYHTCRFGSTLGQNLEDSASADLSLVSMDYKSWYLLFVVPSRNADVDSLIANLNTAKLHSFGPREVGELERQIAGLDRERVNLMVLEGPKFVVVTDNPRHGWSEKFIGLEVEIMIVEPFLSGDQYIIRINGDNPAQSGTDVLGTCSPHPIMPGCLVVAWSDLSRAPQPGTIHLKYGDVMTEWDLSQGNPEWYLFSTGIYPLTESPPFELVETPSGTISIRSSLTEA